MTENDALTFNRKDYGNIVFGHEGYKGFYFECGDGWLAPILEALEKMDTIAKAHDVTIRVVQIKEKFGGLRLYTDGVPKELNQRIYDVIDEAEKKCGVTCEVCGKPGKLDTSRSWIQTLCVECEKQKPK